MAYQNLDVVKGTDMNKAMTLVNMIYWMVTDGQKYASKLWYVPLPTNIQEVDMAGLQMFKFKGQQLWSNTGNTGT
jgi:phosphate transport system substrate-binding protein